MWTVLLCDDDALFLDEIKKRIQYVAGGRVQEIKAFKSGEELMMHICDHPNEADILFLDVNLGPCNGVDIAKKVKEIQPNSQIIFVSAYDQYYMEVYEVEHVYFLKKPLIEQHLKKALNKAGEKLDNMKKYEFVLSNKQGVQKIMLSQILYFEKEKRKIHVHTSNGIVSYYEKFENMISQLDRRFYRCHNSYIVNIQRIKKLENKKFYFENGREVPISKSYYPQVRDIFLQYLDNSRVLESGNENPLGQRLDKKE